MIRLAVVDDIPALMEMGTHFHQGTEYRSHLASNPEQIRRVGEILIAADGLLVLEDGGNIVGMFGFMVFPHFLSGESTAGEVFWWVEPGRRGDGIRLLRKAEDLARQRGAVRMQMIAPTEQVATVYRRMGYEFVESAYQRTL